MSARVIRSDLETCRRNREAAAFLLMHLVNGINTVPGRPGNPLIQDDLIHIFEDELWIGSRHARDPQSDYESAIESAYMQEWVDKIGNAVVLTAAGFEQFKLFELSPHMHDALTGLLTDILRDGNLLEPRALAVRAREEVGHEAARYLKRVIAEWENSAALTATQRSYLQELRASDELRAALDEPLN